MILAETQNVILPALPDLLWGSVCFLIIVIAVMKFAWPKFSALLDERGEKIQAGLDAAEEARAEVASEREKIEVEIREAELEAGRIRQRAQDNADEIRSRAREEAKVEAERTVAVAQSRIAADREAAVRVLRGDVGDLAVKLANRIVGEQVRLNPEVNQGVVDSFLDELEQTEGSKSATPAGGQGA
ncbi:F-type H+-transporting ATPase subunit b [Actinobaculum suis]|uniref:ATP synthase subunit b n=1 Tax=Actinobaculum suis TaxID=1657 RepID=A0A0K9EQV5_9ACTO|nr:F0F1 ATP synthase subunit B [Actinobaculum suis]KMY22548.1 ATP synthase F0F1 subunit B [Actinobaculum suis]MDY5152993.1 F0F1 ATP synthase subunit B [Actinobaculum suis]OCA94632.1 ATP synthase F0 subunit B [Actinobaculum suis]OCA94944.1 ATP synthase F0 subunit B [Actinobaculum suis]SDE37976.1 F-type H+-transporting ATPase subunit b [Actinobaculum suis]